MEKVFNVKILKATAGTWYENSDFIGKEYPASEIIDQPHLYKLYDTGAMGTVLKSDCEITASFASEGMVKTNSDWHKLNNPLKGIIDYCESLEKPRNILQEADAAVYGDRQADYGTVTANFNTIADLWSTTLKSILKENITPEQVGLCMIQVKVARQMYKPKKDNLVDIAGYAATLEKLEKGE